MNLDHHHRDNVVFLIFGLCALVGIPLGLLLAVLT